ncbi:hypothetical protein EV421DRAFT_1734578 [Armillaria borealis]|uniref:MYND-type domain-containing protein n=1 Tax=Armillaria borealis TaxID=47425 RepID=A0AA39JSX0_9AGAR|nr:hypothetical protein EV421DRAFT_1734578 [Armillaria borealis]
MTSMQSLPQTPPPLIRLGCANQSVSKSSFCPKDATNTCSGCRLVRYCSKECQVMHWTSHKHDCKNQLNSKSWSPVWLRERRIPKFIHIDSDKDTSRPGQSLFGMDMSLWGSMEAIDIINAENNEVSGDLRNVVRTINQLPEDYTGTTEIVLNDFNPIVVCRNLMILSILGTIGDVEEAAEHALHLWYSAFQPWSYETHILPHLRESDTLANLNGSPVQLTSSTTMLAFEEWRLTGLVKPFGATSAHMTIANQWLFTPDRRLILDDSANLLKGWNLDEMFTAGMAHGTTEDDLMGCLFFYVKDQLVEFSKRLRRFKIKIYSFDQDPTDLPETLESRASLPQNFDRVEVSNLVDIGIVILAVWGPLLNKANPHAAIIGLFMNWTMSREAGNALSSETATSLAMQRMAACPYATLPSPDPFPGTTMDWPFECHLMDEEEVAIAREGGLRHRRRCFAKLGAAPKELPYIDSPERWYRVASLSGRTFCERYAEWARAAAVTTWW